MATAAGAGQAARVGLLVLLRGDASSRPANDCRISCNAASRATETAARFLRRFENGLAESAPPWSADCYRAALAARANQRRVVSFLQRLDRAPFRAPLGSFTFENRRESRHITLKREYLLLQDSLICLIY